MESLEHMVDKVTEFFLSTLPYSRASGPFSHSQLQDMFKAAQFCEEIASGKLPPSFDRVVEQLQNQFPLLAASQQLLFSLGDNIKVNRQLLDFARKLHDKQGNDLDSWLYCNRRNQIREQFLMASRAVKGTKGWGQLRSYICLVELSRKEDRWLSKLVMERTDRLLGALLVPDLQFARTQQKIIENLQNVLNLDRLQSLNKEVLAEVMSERQEVVKIIVKVIADALNNDQTLDGIEKVATVLVSFLKLIKQKVLKEFMERLEMLIWSRFAKEELINFIVVKIS